jgi:hypothetical protein
LARLFHAEKTQSRHNSPTNSSEEPFYQGRLEGREPEQAELMAAYDRVWEEALSGHDGKPAAPIRYPARTDNPAAMRELAERMLGVFLVQVRARRSEIIAVEEEFAVELSPDLPVLKGRIDLIEIVSGPGGRRLNLVDIKTSAKRIDLADLDRDQLGLYAIAVRKTGLLGQFDLPLTLEALVVTKTKASEAISLGLQPDRDGEGRAIAKARAIWRAMSLGICYPAPGWQCGNCGYSRRCAKWPETE